MSDFPATGQYAIYSMQKPVSGIPGAQILNLAEHNYLALVGPDGNIIKEIHGVPTKGFTVNGAVPGDYLQVYECPGGANAYLSKEQVLFSKQVTFGDQATITGLFEKAFVTLSNTLDEKHYLYDGVDALGTAVNSNSVWNTGLKVILDGAGLGSDTQPYNGPGNTPGDGVDLRFGLTNNPAMLQNANPADKALDQFNYSKTIENGRNVTFGKQSMLDPDNGFTVTENDPDNEGFVTKIATFDSNDNETQFQETATAGGTISIVGQDLKSINTSISGEAFSVVGALSTTITESGAGTSLTLDSQRWPRKIGQGDKLIPTDRRTGFYGQGYEAAVFG